MKNTVAIEEIKTQLIKVSNDLEVNLSDLENYIDLIKKESSLKEIQETLITQVVNLISFENPDWAYVAGRLLMLKTQGEVLSNRGFAYENFSLTLKTLIEKNIYDSSLNSYSQEEIEELGAYISPERDMLYDYAGANMLVNRYLIKYLGNTYELPQEVFMCISMLLAINEKDRVTLAKKFYDVLSLKKVSLATPMLANLRVPNGNLSSCFITAIDDNIESIFYNIDAIAKISKNGGGIGVNISRY